MQTINQVLTYPDSTFVNQSTSVIVTARVGATSILLPDSVTLLRYDSAGKLVANLGRMYDDGTHGDITSGDHVFTTVVTITENSPQILYFRVLAANRGALRRTVSDAAPFSISSFTIARCLHEDQEIHFRPSDGLIVQPNGDAGDTAQREGWYWFGVWIRQYVLNDPWIDNPTRRLSFDEVLQKLEPNGDGIFVRAPEFDPTGERNNEHHGFTRDQMIPLVAAMGVWGRTDALQRLWEALPEDILGKHDFQGHWKNLITGQTWPSDPVRDVDKRDCTLQVDTRDCPLQVDTRSCGFDVCSFFGCAHFNDPFCEAAKATQNAIYAGNKAACEAAKAAQNAIYVAAKDACEVAKATQNAIYVAAKAKCETDKVVDKAFLVAQKEAGVIIFTGDILFPMTYNLFLRAGVFPITFFPATALAVSPVGFELGEANLKAEIGIRNLKASRDRDDVGDDLNDIVMLLMARLRLQTLISRGAILTYATRDASFGSYLETYCSKYGPITDNSILVNRITEGIRNGGWQPDVFAPYGAVRWYHRAITGGNPKLATLYQPIINTLLH